MMRKRTLSQQDDCPSAFLMRQRKLYAQAQQNKAQTNSSLRNWIPIAASGASMKRVTLLAALASLLACNLLLLRAIVTRSSFQGQEQPIAADSLIDSFEASLLARDIDLQQSRAVVSNNNSTLDSIQVQSSANNVADEIASKGETTTTTTTSASTQWSEYQMQLGIDCLCPLAQQQYTTQHPCLVFSGTGLSRSLYFSLLRLLSDNVVQRVKDPKLDFIAQCNGPKSPLVSQQQCQQLLRAVSFKWISSLADKSLKHVMEQMRPRTLIAVSSYKNLIEKSIAQPQHYTPLDYDKDPAVLHEIELLSQLIENRATGEEASSSSVVTDATHYIQVTTPSLCQSGNHNHAVNRDLHALNALLTRNALQSPSGSASVFDLASLLVRGTSLQAVHRWQQQSTNASLNVDSHKQSQKSSTTSASCPNLAHGQQLQFKQSFIEQTLKELMSLSCRNTGQQQQSSSSSNRRQQFYFYNSGLVLTNQEQNSNSTSTGLQSTSELLHVTQPNLLTSLTQTHDLEALTASLSKALPVVLHEHHISKVTFIGYKVTQQLFRITESLLKRTSNNDEAKLKLEFAPSGRIDNNFIAAIKSAAAADSQIIVSVYTGIHLPEKLLQFFASVNLWLAADPMRRFFLLTAPESCDETPTNPSATIDSRKANDEMREWALRMPRVTVVDYASFIEDEWHSQHESPEQHFADEPTQGDSSAAVMSSADSARLCAAAFSIFSSNKDTNYKTPLPLYAHRMLGLLLQLIDSDPIEPVQLSKLVL